MKPKHKWVFVDNFKPDGHIEPRCCLCGDFILFCKMYVKTPNEGELKTDFVREYAHRGCMEQITKKDGGELMVIQRLKRKR